MGVHCLAKVLKQSLVKAAERTVVTGDEELMVDVGALFWKKGRFIRFFLRSLRVTRYDWYLK